MNNHLVQIKLYQEAISKFSPEKSPLDELAWLRLQLSMSYVANGDDKNANSQLELLNTMENGGKFLQYVKNIYGNADTSPLAFCDALYSFIAFQDMPESIGSEIDVNLTHYAYPIDFAPIAELVCPFSSVLESRLAKLKIPSSKSPIDEMVKQGYSFAWFQSLDWDNDSVQEWLGILQFEQPVLVFMDGNENWQIKTIEIHSTVLSVVDSASYTPEDGTGLKILILLSSSGKYCNSPDTVKWLIEINPESAEYENMYLCDSNTYSLTSGDGIQFALQEFSKPNYYETYVSPNWFYLPEFIEDTYQQKTILDLVDELEDRVVSQINSIEIADEISSLIDSLPDDDPAAQLLLSRLYYLHGFNYEMNGDSELAVDAYLELIKFFPQSLWSQYAQIRIQPIK